MSDIGLSTVGRLPKTVDAGLCSGMGEPKPGEMCVEAAVRYCPSPPLFSRDKPKAIERNKGLFVTCCMLEGLTLREAYEAFDRANRRLWASACA